MFWVCHCVHVYVSALSQILSMLPFLQVNLDLFCRMSPITAAQTHLRHRHNERLQGNTCFYELLAWVLGCGGLFHEKASRGRIRRWYQHAWHWEQRARWPLILTVGLVLGMKDQAVISLGWDFDIFNMKISHDIWFWWFRKPSITGSLPRFQVYKMPAGSDHHFCQLKWQTPDH